MICDCSRMRPKTKTAIEELLDIMARLRSPTGCPWDLQQDHRTLRYHAVEEVYELMDAIEAGDDHEMAEELGDLLLRGVSLSIGARAWSVRFRSGFPPHCGK